jgi:hypothetical protein
MFGLELLQCVFMLLTLLLLLPQQRHPPGQHNTDILNVLTTICFLELGESVVVLWLLFCIHPPGQHNTDILSTDIETVSTTHYCKGLLLGSNRGWSWG